MQYVRQFHETYGSVHRGASFAVHFHFRLRSTISVHKFPSTTTSVNISPPRYSLIACACAHMNELKTGKCFTGSLKFLLQDFEFIFLKGKSLSSETVYKICLMPSPFVGFHTEAMLKGNLVCPIILISNKSFPQLVSTSAAPI